MKIKSLPKNIQVLAYKYKGEQDEQFEYIQDFSWNDSDEGHWFWNLVEQGEFGKAMEFREIYENLSDFRCPNFDALIVDNGKVVKQWVTDCTGTHLDLDTAKPYGRWQPYDERKYPFFLNKKNYIAKEDTSLENLQNQKKEEVESLLKDLKKRVQEDVISTTVLGAYKETQGKVDYSEIDWDFITQIAERLNSSKGKYEKDNWKKPMDTNLLIQASLRHMIEILKGNFEDEGRKQGHIEAVVTNMMMLNFQLKNLVD